MTTDGRPHDDEAAMVARIRAIFRRHDALVETEDDDTARVDQLLATHVTTDVAVEGQDFDRAFAPLRCFGHRVMVQNLSDLAAADADPRGFVWSLAIPERWRSVDVDAFCEGAAAVCGAVGLPLLGGDLSGTDGPFAAAVTAFGHAPAIPVARRGARAGQHLWLSKPCGAAAAGLRLLREAQPGDDEGTFHTWRRGLDPVSRRAVDAWTTPVPAHPFARLSDFAVAAIDVSDGLLKDASRLAAANGLGVRFDALELAIDVAAGATRDDALAGGEDWAILAAVPDGLEPDGGLCIGRFVDDVARGTLWTGGHQLAPRGWDHFRRSGA